MGSSKPNGDVQDSNPRHQSLHRSSVPSNRWSRVSARAVAPSKVYVIPQDALLSSYASLPEALLAMRRHVDATVDALLEKETIDGYELDALIEKYTGSVMNKRPEMIAV